MLPQAAPSQGDPQTLSAYVRRMMSLDRNSDGYLSAGELPGKLSEMLQSYDGNHDGKLSTDELAAVEDAATAGRNPTPDSKTSNRAEPRRGAGRSPRRGGGDSPGSPLDARQILRFALTFDVDGDGGLNATELEKYAFALAARRAQQGRPGGRRQPDDTEKQPSPRRNVPGLDTPGDHKDDPFKAKPPGLGADGAGGGGFGDTPSPKAK